MGCFGSYGQYGIVRHFCALHKLFTFDIFELSALVAFAPEVDSYSSHLHDFAFGLDWINSELQ